MLGRGVQDHLFRCLGSNFVFFFEVMTARKSAGAVTFEVPPWDPINYGDSYGAELAVTLVTNLDQILVHDNAMRGGDKLLGSRVHSNTFD